MLTRREILKRSSLFAFAPFVPGFIPRLASAAEAETAGRILVVVELEGGNDGLNMVVPYADDQYAKSRPTLRVPESEVLKLDKQFGLHPSMRGAHELFEDGRLGVVHAVGYPNPNRSHFKSMAIWQSGQNTEAEEPSDGWIGRAFSELRVPRRGAPDAVYIGTDETPLALHGRSIYAASLSRVDDLAIHGTTQPSVAAKPNDLESFVAARMLQAFDTSSQLSKSLDNATEHKYPATELGRQLSLVANLIRSGGGTRVYYVVQNGYDTHSGQNVQHRELLGNLSDSIKAFLDDLRADRLSQGVAVVTFSEFGRRVAENDSRGTDHGAAAPVLIAGDGIHAGLHGAAPDLAKLADGDIQFTTDFRAVYATLLERWMKMPTRDALGGAFAPLDLFT